MKEPAVQRQDVSETALRRVLIVAAVMAAALMQTLDSTITNVALPNIQGNLGASQDEGTWIVTAYTISAIIIIGRGFWTFAIPLALKGAGSVMLFIPLSIAILGATIPADGPKSSAFFNLSTQLGGSTAVARLRTNATLANIATQEFLKTSPLRKYELRLLRSMSTCVFDGHVPAFVSFAVQQRGHYHRWLASSMRSAHAVSKRCT